ncbi:MAG: hypothetical protein FWD81_03645 [Methanomassiliicoccaceae archaeon]|nr:hypothetical protein [Methanomassiliicoccaceae archaeon]
MFSKDYVKEKINRFNRYRSLRQSDHVYTKNQNNKEHSDPGWSFEYSFIGDDAWDITASCEWGTIAIKILDERGICSITPDDNMEKTSLNEKLWKEFRKILDGCSDTPADCTAMRLLMTMDKGSVEETIANAFIDAMESTSDSGRHVIGKNPTESLKQWKRKTELTMNLYNIPRSNYMYFRRFMQIYSKELMAVKSDLDEIMKSRYEKAVIVADHNLRSSEFGFKTRSLEYTKVSWIIAIGVAVAAAVVAIFLGLL